MGFNDWKTSTPPQDVDLELLCVLFDSDEYRELKIDEYDNWNRQIVMGKWNGSYFTGNYARCNGDPFLEVVAWREIDYGMPFYDSCIGECRS